MTVGAVPEGIRQRVTLLPYLVGYCRWNRRSGPYNMPDNQPCDLVSQTTVKWGATVVVSRKNYYKNSSGHIAQ